MKWMENANKESFAYKIGGIMAAIVIACFMVLVLACTVRLVVWIMP